MTPDTGPDWAESRLMFAPMSEAQAAAIASWRYDGAWSVYDETEPISTPAAYHAATGPEGELVGFYCLGDEARVSGIEAEPGTLDLGLGLHPDLVGAGRGAVFARAVLAHCRSTLTERRVRVCIQSWNERSRRLALSVGFTESGHHVVASTDGDVDYVVLVLDRADPGPPVGETSHRQ